MSQALVLRDIDKRFRGVTALTSVDLELRRGEVLGLIGPNGSGKTTLLGIASGVLAPTAGRVTVAGRELGGAGPTTFAQAGVGRTFQQVRLFEGLTVEETVALGAIAKGEDITWAAGLLQSFGLEELGSREAPTLAYGDQRRVEIARAMAGQPDFLLLDEPAAGMNAAETDQLLATLQRVASGSGCGVLIVDHDLRLIMRICDRVQVLNEGATIAQGPPDKVRRDPGVIAAYIGGEARKR